MRETAPGDERSWIAVAALVLVALVTRLIGLDSGLWVDEIYSLVDSFRPPLISVLTEYPSDTQHPLYSLFANASLKALGESPWTVRLPALLFGVASVPVLYTLGARVSSRREGLAAAALLAVSYHHVWFSQNARGYTMLAFWALLSTLFLHEGLRTGRRSALGGYGIVIGCAVYTHLTMVFMVAAHLLVAGTWVFMRRAQSGARPSDVVMGFGVGVVTGALLYAPIFTQVLDFFLNQPSQLEGISTPSWALSEALRVLGIGAGTIVGLLAGGLLFALGARDYARRQPLALALFLAPGAVTLVGALLARGTMYPRFYFFMIGFVFLIAVRGAYLVGDFVERRMAGRAGGSTVGGLSAGTVLATAMVLVSAVTLRANYAAPKQDFGGALAFVEGAAEPADVIMTVGVTTYPYRELYGRSFEELTPAAREQHTRDGRAVWVLYTFERYLDESLLRSLRGECETARVFPGTVGGGAITVCRYPPNAPRREGAEP